MNMMLANRYLLNGNAEKAILLYRKAVENSGSMDARCRLILAYLKAEKATEAAKDLIRLYDENGARCIADINEYCCGYGDLPQQDDGNGDPLAAGLRLLFEGRTNESIERFKQSATRSKIGRKLYRIVTETTPSVAQVTNNRLHDE